MHGIRGLGLVSIAVGPVAAASATAGAPRRAWEHELMFALVRHQLHDRHAILGAILRVLLVDLHQQSFHLSHCRFVPSLGLAADTQLQRLLGLALLGPLQEAGSSPSQTQLGIRGLHDLLHVLAAGPDNATSHSELIVILDPNVETTSVFTHSFVILSGVTLQNTLRSHHPLHHIRRRIAIPLRGRLVHLLRRRVQQLHAKLAIKALASQRLAVQIVDSRLGLIQGIKRNDGCITLLLQIYLLHMPVAGKHLFQIVPSELILEGRIFDRQPHLHTPGWRVWGATVRAHLLQEGHARIHCQRIHVWMHCILVGHHRCRHRIGRPLL
mmetsp:Transcript_39148/g.94022  ORF Transcript_39148/g.94022 Transcript_39148/m.94022 type:complete len:325 (+) Transcript_39148:868-1842(+)